MISEVSRKEKITASKANEVIRACNRLDSSSIPKVGSELEAQSRRFLRAIPVVDEVKDPATPSLPPTPFGTFAIWLGDNSSLGSNLSLLDWQVGNRAPIFSLGRYGSTVKIAEVYSDPDGLIAEKLSPSSSAKWWISKIPRNSQASELWACLASMEYETAGQTSHRDAVVFCTSPSDISDFELFESRPYVKAKVKLLEAQAVTIKNGPSASQVKTEQVWYEFDTSHLRTDYDNMYKPASELISNHDAGSISLGAPFLSDDFPVLQLNNFSETDVPWYVEQMNHKDARLSTTTLDTYYMTLAPSCSISTVYHELADTKVQKQETLFLTKTIGEVEGNDGKTVTIPILEYKPVKFRQPGTFADWNVSQFNSPINYGNLTGYWGHNVKQHSIAGLLPGGTGGFDGQVLQLHDFNNESNVSGQVINLAWEQTYDITNGDILTRKRTGNVRELRYEKTWLVMPKEPISEAEKSWIEGGILDLSNAISDMMDDFWLRGGDNWTCYGHAIGDGRQNTKIILDQHPVMPGLSADVTLTANKTWLGQDGYVSNLCAIQDVHAQSIGTNFLTCGIPWDSTEARLACTSLDFLSGGNTYSQVGLTGMFFVNPQLTGQQLYANSSGLTAESLVTYGVLRIGNTTLNETQLCALLALIT